MNKIVEFKNKYPDLLQECILHISGSQGVAPASMIIKYGKDYQDEESLCRLFDEFIDENALDNIDDYLDDCDGDEDEAMMETIIDSGDFEIFLHENDDKPIYVYTGFLSKYDDICL